MTHNQFIKLFRDIATAHKDINSFGTGDLWEYMANEEATLLPVTLWVVPKDNAINEFVDKPSYTFLLMDFVNKDESNEDEVLSDTNRIAKDVIAILRQPYYEDFFEIEKSFNLTNFTERFDSEVSGWQFDIVFKQPFIYDSCQVNQTGLPLINGNETPSYYTTTPLLTLTTNGTSGAATWTPLTGVLNIPIYGSSTGTVTTLTATNGTGQNWTITNPTTTPNISLALTTEGITESTNLYFTNARAIASTLTGYTSGAGTISASDSILSAIQKLNGNIGALVTGVSSVNSLTGAVALTGTTNRITISGANVFDISASYVGQSSITTLGTIGTGVWQGTAIGDTYISSASTWNAKESALTFSTGLTRSINTITIDSTVATLTGSQALTNKTYNGLTLTSTTGTLTISNGKTVTQSNTLTYSGTDGSSVAFGAGGTVSYNNTFTEQFQMGTVNITTGNTYYFSNIFSATSGVPRTTVGQCLVTLPYSCTLIGAVITTWTSTAGQAGTAGTLSIRYNGSDTTLSSAIVWSNSSATPTQFTVTGLSLAMTAGTTYELKYVTGGTTVNNACIRVVLFYTLGN